MDRNSVRTLEKEEIDQHKGVCEIKKINEKKKKLRKNEIRRVCVQVILRKKEKKPFFILQTSMVMNIEHAVENNRVDSSLCLNVVGVIILLSGKIRRWLKHTHSPFSTFFGSSFFYIFFESYSPPKYKTCLWQLVD